MRISPAYLVSQLKTQSVAFSATLESQIRAIGSNLSPNNPHELGSLHLRRLLLTSQSLLSPDILKFEDRVTGGYARLSRDEWTASLRELIGSSPSASERLEKAMAWTTQVHETRHFHDAYCTFHGWGAFSRWFQIMCHISLLLQRHAFAGGIVTTPMHERQPKEGAEVERIRSLWQVLRSEELLDLGGRSFARMEQSQFDWHEPPELAIASIPVGWGSTEKIEIPTVPLRLGFVDGEVPEYFFLLWPIGFREITEYLAQKTQKEILFNVDEELAEDYYQAQRAGTDPVSGAISHFVTRWMRNRGRHEIYGIDSLHHLLTAGLLTSGQSLFLESESWHREHCGWKFLDHLVHSYDVKADEVIEATTYREELRLGLSLWEQEVSDFTNHFSTEIVKLRGEWDIWVKFAKLIVDRVARPAVNLYLERQESIEKSDDWLTIAVREGAFARGAERLTGMGRYIFDIGEKLPRPLVQVAPGRWAGPTGELHQDVVVYILWSRWILHVEAIEQAFGRSTLTCPWRSSSELTWVIRQNKELLPTHDCQRDDGCPEAVHALGSVLEHPPRCPWEEILAAYGFVNYSGTGTERLDAWRSAAVWPFNLGPEDFPSSD